MMSGVIRTSVRSRRRCLITSWPAACGIRWVKPSIATVSPSCTVAAIASASDTISATSGPILLAAFTETISGYCRSVNSCADYEEFVDDLGGNREGPVGGRHARVDRDLEQHLG